MLVLLSHRFLALDQLGEHLAAREREIDASDGPHLLPANGKVDGQPFDLHQGGRCLHSSWNKSGHHADLADCGWPADGSAM